MLHLHPLLRWEYNSTIEFTTTLPPHAFLVLYSLVIFNHGIPMSKCDQFECQVQRVEWCFSIHMEHFYTTESGEHIGKFSYLQASHVFNISHCETTRVEEYSDGCMNKIGK